MSTTTIDDNPPGTNADHAARRGWRDAVLWLREFGLVALAYVIIMGVAYCGWSASFIGLHDFGTEHMGFSDVSAWYVPGAIDGAAFGLTIVVAVESMRGRPAFQWRILVWAYTALSAWINWEHIDDPLGRGIACLLPISAVTLFEGLMYRARKAHQDRQGANRPRLSIHPLRFFFDWSGTWEIIRCHVLDIALPAHLAEAQQKVEEKKAQQQPKSNRRRSPRKPKSEPKADAQKGTPKAIQTPEPETDLETTQPMPRLVHGGRQNSKASRAKAWVLSQWREGRVPTTAEIDERYDCRTLGRKTLQRLAEDGHVPPDAETDYRRDIAAVQ